MWIFTKYGFFSAVCAREGSGRHGQPVDPDRIMIRARLLSHLEALLKRFPWASTLVASTDKPKTTSKSPPSVNAKESRDWAIAVKATPRAARKPPSAATRCRGERSFQSTAT